MFASLFTARRYALQHVSVFIDVFAVSHDRFRIFIPCVAGFAFGHHSCNMVSDASWLLPRYLSSRFCDAFSPQCPEERSWPCD